VTIFFPPKCCFLKKLQIFSPQKQGMYNKIPFLFLELKFCDNPPERNYKEVKKYMTSQVSSMTLFGKTRKPVMCISPFYWLVTQLALPSLVTSRLLCSIQHCCFLSSLYHCWSGIEKTPSCQYGY